MKLDLNGKWYFKEKTESDFAEATVPGNNFSDLLSLEKIPDPFVGNNEELMAGVYEKEWIYKKTFDAPPELLKYEKLFLVFSQLDTMCIVTINDKEFKTFNAFIEWRFDVTDILKEKNNIITVQFISPVQIAKTAYALCKTPINENGLDGIAHIRKPACHYGWDWGPNLPISGITGDVYIEGFNTARISDFSIKQHHLNDGSVTLSLFQEIEKFSAKKLSAKFSILCPNGQELIFDGIEFDNGFKAEIVIEKPQLWWIKELSNKDKQPLYEAIASIFDRDTLIDGKIVKIGLRTVKLNREQDEYGQNFCFELNGVKIFAKGANYIPQDSLITRVDKNQIDKIISAISFSNMNMVRIWGGGYYASNYFLDRCDEEGILVWQDFMFACQGYPLFLNDFINNVLNEAEFIIKKLRNHPSLCLWCGNNEIEQMSPLWYHMQTYITATEKYFYRELPDLVKKLDDRDYIPGSPVGLDYMLGYNRDNVGDSHLWQVWHGLQNSRYYRKRYPRFCSEYGLESMPEEKTLKYFITEDNPSFKSPSMKLHQKCRGGNGKIKYYCGERFVLPSNFFDYSYVSQLCQAEACKDALMHWRRNKGRCNGGMYWQLNDCWPVCSWSSVDYFNRYKALQYYARRFNKPVNVSIEDSDGGFYVYALNDTNISYQAKLIFKVCKYDGKVIVMKENDITINANESQNIMALGMAIVRNAQKHLYAYAVAQLFIDDREVARDTLLLRREKYAKLPAPEISKTLELSADGILSITLSSNTFARGVRITNNLCDQPFSDNWFDLLPGEPVTVTQNINNAYPLDIIENEVKIFTATDLSKKGNAFTTAMSRLCIYLNPVNYFSHLFTKKVPRDLSKRYIENIDIIRRENE